MPTKRELDKQTWKEIARMWAEERERVPMPTLITSFGYHYGAPDTYPGHPLLVIDVRLHFNRNPHRDRTLRHLRGDDPRIEADILKTPGFEASYAALKARVAAHPGPVWLGCTGGRHRSVYLACRLGRELGVPVQHRDYWIKWKVEGGGSRT